jgi:Cu-Zn family superoxide dismutase
MSTMSTKTTLFVAAIWLTCTAVASGQDAVPMAKAELHNGHGELVGIATLAETINGVRVVAQVYGLRPGYHGFHVHEVGKCEPPGFKSAGEHFNPYDAHHGLKDPKGFHAGDLPNLLVAPDGTGVLVAYAPHITLRAGQNSLFRDGGTAVVVHSQPDDQRTDPSGNSGDRLACGVVTRAIPGT